MTVIPLIYSSRFSVALGALRRYDAWYAQHALDLLSVGFSSVHGYRSSAGPRALCNLYEIPDLRVFGDGYRHARDRDVAGKSMRTSLSPAALAVFRTEHQAGDRAVLASPGLAVFEFTPHDGHDEVERWYENDELRALTGGGVITARLCRAVPAPVAPEPAASYRLLLSTATPEDAFVVSDSLLDRYTGRWGAEPERHLLDVLTHRITYPAP